MPPSKSATQHGRRRLARANGGGVAHTKCLLFVLGGTFAALCILNLSVDLTQFTTGGAVETHLEKHHSFHKRAANRIMTTGEQVTDERGKPVVSVMQQEQQQQQQQESTLHRNLLFAGSDEPGMQDVPDDPLRASNFTTPRGQAIDLKPATPYLGVLLDGGRHYFPVIWIKRLLDRLSDMNYNLLHFRLTDDQTFNVLLKSHPELAYPTAVNNPDRLVYTVDELREITAYAKERGIRIMPEINVPGHAGSWAGGRPDLIVHCPKFICDKGYGLPLNVSHPDVDMILQNVLTEIVDIFDDPPFLHLGGDEVNMANPCFKELGKQLFDYQAFEVRLKLILQKINYPNDQVVRWEMTGQKKLNRAGRIEQFWESHPGVRHDATGPFFVSTWLYFDTNGDQTAFDVYEKTRVSFSLKGGKFPTAIIAGTFELSTEFWYDRNVLGKLLAVAMGASNDKQYGDVKNEAERKAAILDDWGSHCDQLGLGDALCNTKGIGVIPHSQYLIKWKAKWEIWKADICERLAVFDGKRSFAANREREQHRVATAGSDFFWENFPLDKTAKIATTADSSAVLPKGWENTLGEHAAPNVGAILDVTSSMVVPARLSSIITDYVARLGLNMVQLPLVNNNGFIYRSQSQASLTHSLLASPANPHYDIYQHLRPLVQKAADHGVAMMPEVSVSTDAAGWFKAGFVVGCPNHFCQGKGLPIDVNRPKMFPILYSVIGELYKVFSSPYIHLGSDERQAAEDCFLEAGGGGETSNYDRFETKLMRMLEMTGISSDNILRWENAERKRYLHRTGNITHYRAGMSDVKPSSSSSFFVTVDIVNGDGWSVYQRTRELVALQPTGILAEIRTLTETRWKTLDIPKRLIAFALGVSPQGSLDPKNFQTKFSDLCEALGWSSTGGCSPPTAIQEEVTYITDGKAFSEQHCNLNTVKDMKYSARKPVLPFYPNGSMIASEVATN